MAAKKEDLVNCLADTSLPDMAYIRDFLLTYLSFMTSDELLDRLIQRYEYAPPPNATPEQLKENEMWSGPIRLRVINVVKKWVECNYYFDDDPKLLQVSPPFKFVKIYN